ncbi:MAG: NAD-dependent epimerase/dehydratase family protein [Rickettsiales bacterium]|nr:NAD-dependent epimerase/dehydratase family protein [Pseudomonadota bacterium]MDA0966803.1 NAD-dependent epimerase/dehydratase family protein [Pseudomonadota bacterium]MDG4543475.1 NAD-dependent epimerase/dehydratase family protein [Rickettsiales bacterium]MDG4546131.1 NAD-dependent epimerase/dehydratase family protein [Rickettsiales bacterium]MDG4547604.1 NAD-dependent epimerase/dehydratase family protein [Rickettsiales bacterium]
MTILITGAAGFIGYHVAKKLLERGEKIIGIDNLNDYYDVNLKKDRLELLKQSINFAFYHTDISGANVINDIASKHRDINKVVHLAAQAGVRYSLENPFAYINSNLVGHAVILEMCRNLDNFEHLVYASSSSVYGGNTKLPFSTKDSVDHPLSLYAATKKADELLSHSYSHLYNIPTTGLRFFTVYGSWGRPDMATFLFTKAISEGKPIDVFNNGDMRRDFTYIDDIVEGTISALDNPPSGKPPYKVYNLGNNTSENLMDFIGIIEESLDKKAEINFKPMHIGDVKETYADIEDTKKDLGFSPKTTIRQGLPKFIEWYKSYYSK